MNGRCACLALALAAVCLAPALPRAARPLQAARPLEGADSLPGRLTDREFWQLIEDVSEPNGTFRSENLLSNELQFQYVLSEVLRTTKPGRAYLGVGPEQNFTYIAALKPAIAFIIDIRRANLDLHLLYKAIFELSADRAEFVSLLFSRPRPEGLGAHSSAGEIFDAFAGAANSERLFGETMSAIRNQLYTKHNFEVPEDDLRGIEYVFRAYFMLGPGIRYSPMGLTGGTIQPTYGQLMGATDEQGRARAFLAGEEAFRAVKDLESRNLIVPLVGNFAGARAIRGVGAYLKRRGASVGAFYLSNVEEYLRPEGLWQDFCANTAALPYDAASVFIRSVRSPSGNPADGLLSATGPLAQIASCR